ncbi:DUF2213 domain-containing protein [Nitratireductor sp. PBL-C9]|uniref:DUF2213 domain-containing protein n=1 Tax=Nitratireductor sp. PBL-C9 TaxID=3435013 RepID=UPI003D7E8F47
MKFLDTASVAGTRRTADGYLVAEVRTARTGIQDYAGWEVGKPEKQVVRVYRPAEQVFAKDSLASYAHRPVTNDHPDEAVSAENWKDFAVGQIGDEVARDGEFVRIPLIVMDAAAIKDVEAGKRELSAGYTCDLAFEPGTTPDGQSYDAIQKNIKINHVAIVSSGRAGSQARIGDDAANSWGVRPAPGHAPITPSKKEDTMSDALKTVVLGDKAVQVAVADVVAIEKFKADSAKALADAEAAHTEAITAKDTEIGTLKADLKKAQDAALKPEDVSKLVADRVALESTVKAISADITTDGKTDADLRKEAVAKALGDEMVKDASDAEISGMFKAVAKDTAAGDQVRDTLTNLKPVNDANKAQQSYVDRMTGRGGSK